MSIRGLPPVLALVVFLALLVAGSAAFGCPDTETGEGAKRFQDVKTWRLRVNWHGTQNHEEVLDEPASGNVETIKQRFLLDATVDFVLVKHRDSSDHIFIWKAAKGAIPQGAISFASAEEKSYRNKETGEKSSYNIYHDADGIRSGFGSLRIYPENGTFHLSAHVLTSSGAVRVVASPGGSQSVDGPIHLQTWESVPSDWDGVLPVSGLNIASETRQSRLAALSVLPAAPPPPVSLSWQLEPMEKIKSDCDSVRSIISDEKKLRDAFNNGAACTKAKTGPEFRDWAYKQVFGESAREGENYSSPMFTDPTTCIIHKSKGWERCGPMRKGEPPVVYDADLAHEEVHSSSCKEYRSPLLYNAEMNNKPCKLGAEENVAYKAGIDMLQDWYDKNCKE
jgi:hypothetical protein